MKWFSISVFLCIAVFITSSENGLYNSFKLRNIKCRPVEEFITNTTCTIKAIARDKFLLNMDADVVKTLKKITVTANLYKFYNGYRFLQGLTFNACDIFSKKKFHPLTNIVISSTLKFTNLFNPCPVSGHVFVRNASYSPGVIDFMLSSGKFKVYVNVFEGYPLVSVGTIEFYADIGEFSDKY